MTFAKWKGALQVGGALAVIVLALAALYAAYRHGVTVTNHKRDAQWATAIVNQERARVLAVQAARAEERRLQREANQVGSDARKQNAAADVNAIGLDGAGDRLYVEAGKLAAGVDRCASDAGATERSASTTRAAMVLSQLLERADARAGELAKAYDRALIAGQACERTYDLVTGARVR
jgi:hypothetical protein